MLTHLPSLLTQALFAELPSLPADRRQSGATRLAKLQARTQIPEEKQAKTHDEHAPLDREEFTVEQVKGLRSSPRQLGGDESSANSRAMSRWWPARSKHDDTSPLTGRLASPGRSAILAGLMGGGLGAGAGAMLSHIKLPTKAEYAAARETPSLPSLALGGTQELVNAAVPGDMPATGKGAIVGGVLGALPMAALAYLKQRSENLKMTGYQRRLPHGATLRQVPGYGSVNRPEMKTPGGSGILGDLLNFPELPGG